MSNLTKRSLLILFAMIVLIAIPMSFAADADAADEIAVVDAAADVVAADVDAADEVVADATVDVVAADDDAGDSVSISDVNGTAAYVQELINNASAGDIIDLSTYDSYDFGYTNNVTIATDNVTLKGNGATTIYTNGGNAAGKGQAILVTASNVVITGINFIDTNPNNNFVYGGSVNGWGVQFDGSNDAQGGLVENCTFKDFNQAVAVTGFDHLTVRNCNFTGGYSTLLMNDPSVNKEAGSKVISVGGSFFTTIENNYFEGPVLDAISIAKASGDAKIIGNTFVNNVYAIFFGGASTEGTHIDNNVFINCGSFFEGNISWYAFPVISLEKAANGVSVDGNTFYAMNRNMLIKAEQGNTAHGAASTFGDFNVTNNKVIASPDESNFIGESVTLFHINCKNSVLNPFTNIYANGNELATGVRAVVVWSTEWGTEMVYYGKSANNVSDNVIPKADPQVTKFNDVFVAQNGTIAGTLTDNNNKGVANAIISYLIDGVVANVTADKNGAFAFDAAKGKTVLISFAATDKYAATSFTTNTPEEQPAPVDLDTVTTVTDVTVYAGDSAVLTVTVTANGTVVNNQTVSVKVDNTIKTLTVVNGTATMNVKYTSAGTHYVTAIFSGDGYKTSVGSSVIKVNKKATAITASAATLKAKVAKKITVVLKSGTKAVAGKKVTITVNGKTYSGKTLSNGKAVISVKVLKAGKFYAIVKFAGDGAYTASSKKVLYTVK